jgi:hypothetical protein
MPLVTTSRLPVHNQAWAYAHRLSKQDEIFYSYMNYVPSKILNELARPLLIASQLCQAQYKLTHEPGKAKHVEKQGTKWESHLAQMTRAVAILHQAVQTQHPYMDRDALPNFELTAKAAGPLTEHLTPTDITDITLTPPSADAAKADAATHHSHASVRLPSAMAIPLHRTFAKMQPAVTAITKMRARAAAAAQLAAAQTAAAQAATAQAATTQTTTAQASAGPPATQPAAQPLPSASTSTTSAKRLREDASKTSTENTAKKPKTTSQSSSSSSVTADKLTTSKAVKAIAGASAPSNSDDKHVRKPAAADKSKDADAKKAKAKHAANSNQASSSTSEPKAITASSSSRKPTGATAPAPAAACKEDTPAKVAANAVPAKTTAPADSTRAVDKAQTPATEPQCTHDDAQATLSTQEATDATAQTTDKPSQQKTRAQQLPSVPKRQSVHATQPAQGGSHCRHR